MRRKIVYATIALTMLTLAACNKTDEPSATSSKTTENVTTMSTTTENVTLAPTTTENITLAPTIMETEAKEYTIGDTIKIGNGVAMTLISVEQGYAKLSWDRQKIVKFEVEFENLTEYSQSLYSSDFYCYADGYSLENDTFVDGDFPSTNISSGKKMKATLAYILPDDVKVLELEHDNNGKAFTVEVEQIKEGE